MLKFNRIAAGENEKNVSWKVNGIIDKDMRPGNIWGNKELPALKK